MIQVAAVKLSAYGAALALLTVGASLRLRRFTPAAVVVPGRRRT